MAIQTSRGGPGFDARQDTQESQVFFAFMFNELNFGVQEGTWDSTNLDTTNVPTSTLLGGNIASEEDASGNLYIYDPDANDGRQMVVGILHETISMLDEFGTAQNKANRVVMSAGGALAAELIGLDAQARAQLSRIGILFDDVPEGMGGAFLVHPRADYSKSADYTVLANDNGKQFIATGAVTFALPTIAAGLSFDFLQSADANMVIDGASNILADNNASADKLTFSTATEKIGSRVRIRAGFTATSVLKWFVEVLTNNTLTVS